MQLSLKQSQELQLTMSLQLRQAIELLQLSNAELEQFIREQEILNPLIQLKETPLKESSNLPHSIAPKVDNLIERRVAQKVSLRHDLLQQINCSFSNFKTRQLLHHLVHHLNQDGYLIDYETLPFQTEEIEAGITLLQQVGPPGIAARNLKECLLLQCEADPQCPPYTMDIIRHHLEELANQSKKGILQALPISMSELVKVQNYIKSLQPKFFLDNDIEIHHITPDVIVQIEDDSIQFTINDRYLPKILIVPEYAHFIQKEHECSSYLKKFFADYNWLLSSIEQRRNNLINVMRVLIQHQQNFFLQGENALEPLTLRDVAEQIDIHESTVSRITTNKYVQTPLGTFELKKLFSSKLQTTNGKPISQNKVKMLLIDYINQENKVKPYTDQKICDYFTKIHGIEISRRTIAKYREELHIPNASQRKFSSKLYKK